MDRIKLVQKKLKDNNLDAILVTHLPSIRYLAGFSGSNAMLLVPKTGTPKFFTDFRYEQQVKRQVTNADITIVDRSIIDTIIEKKLLAKFKTLAFESARVTYSTFLNLKKNLKNIKLVPTSEFVEEFTMTKTEEEIKKIYAAAKIGDRVFKEMLTFIRPGMQEREVATEISYRGRQYGSERDAFDVIVASGARSAMPHGIASEKVIEKGDLVTLDFGCVVDGFNSDMTRTIAVGAPSDECKKIYKIVQEAQQRGVDAARSGITAKALDAVARDHIDDAGYGKYFGHSLGHGLGIEVHEMPLVSTKGERFTLAEGWVVTIEPGIYVTKVGGVRIEDDVVIRQNDCDVINQSPKELIII